MQAGEGVLVGRKGKRGKKVTEKLCISREEEEDVMVVAVEVVEENDGAE